jgi:predicted SprT family Zn-dependent metalloprotease
MTGATEQSEHLLEPLPYQVELRDYLKSHERELWNWFASARAQADYTENLRMDLLKSTYRLDAESHPALHQALDEAKARLQLDIPVTLYQAQNHLHANAALYFIPGEGHVVFSGPILSLLDAHEIKSVLGHELAHYHLWQWEHGELHVADRLIHAVAADPRAAASHEHTARRFQLYTEIFADRGSLCVTGDLHPVVAGLVKIETGLAHVSAAAYLRQAEEVFAKDNVSTEGLSHPETFIRARALSLWQNHRREAQPDIARMIEGVEALDGLDLLGQNRLTRNTRRLLEHFLRPKWFQTPAVLGHARLFFDDFQRLDAKDEAENFSLDSADGRLREYLCYVLLDFATVDPELDEMPLAAALEFARQLEMDAQFEKLAAKELRMKVRDVRKLKEQAAELLAKAEAAG